MSRVLASVLRRLLLLSSSSLPTAAHPSPRLLFVLIISASFLFCWILMLRSDERHYLSSHTPQHQQPNQDLSTNTSMSSNFHYLEPVSLSEYHRDMDSDADETVGRLLTPGSSQLSGESGPTGDGLRSITQPSNRLLGNLTSEEWLSLQRSRKALLKQVCHGGISRSTDFIGDCGFRLDGLLVDRSNHVLYCAIPKVASTSVKLAFASMAGQINRTSIDLNYPVHLSSWLRSVGVYSVDYLVKNDPVWLKTAWSSLRKFIIVRHPFERLVSAYVDKFTLRNKFTEFFQHRFGRKIVKLYRNRSELGKKRATDDAGHDVKFSEFVRFLLDKKIRCTQKLNPHWMGFVDVCHPCLVDYDYIIHFEALADEMLHLWKAIYNRTNLDDVLHRRNVGQTRTGNPADDYMNRLPADEVAALHELYSIDFTMFAYT